MLVRLHEWQHAEQSGRHKKGIASPAVQRATSRIRRGLGHMAEEDEEEQEETRKGKRVSHLASSIRDVGARSVYHLQHEEKNDRHEAGYGL